MTNLFGLMRGKRPVAEKRYTVSDYAAWLEQGGGYGIIGGAGGYADTEQIENSFTGYVDGLFKRNAVVFTAMNKRRNLFSEARFCLQEMHDGRPGKLKGDAVLRPLETPWPNGTTGELLSRMIQDADLAGNSYIVKEPGRLRRLRPDWVTIVLTAPPATAVQSDVKGYLYHPGGIGSSTDPEAYLVDEIVHWSPIPDPTAQYRGMSWLSPIIEEIQSDRAATEHKKAFFENGATLQTVITLGEGISDDKFKTWIRKFREGHQGVRNAYEPLFLGGGADAKVVGADLMQLDFKATQGAGETRIASVSDMGAVILMLSEGLSGSSLNAGNFSAVRRLVADGALRPMWRSACAALASIIKVPDGFRLWYDERDIAFLREDVKDLAEIQSTEAQSIRQLVEAGYEPASVVSAIQAQDWSLLKHSGLFSVQLQSLPEEGEEEPVTEPVPEPEPEADPEADDVPSDDPTDETVPDDDEEQEQ